MLKLINRDEYRTHNIWTSDEVHLRIIGLVTGQTINHQDYTKDPSSFNDRDNTTMRDHNCERYVV